MDDIVTNPMLCLLQKTYPTLYKSLFNTNSYSKILLIPNPHSLIGVHINQTFIETHILQETDMPGHYLNLVGQGIEIEDNSIHTSYGFKNQCTCTILKHDRIINGSLFVKVYITDTHLFNDNTELDYLSYDLDNDIEDIIKRWSNCNEEFKNTFYKSLDKFKQTFVFIPGYELESAKIISNLVDRSIMTLLNNKKDYSQCYKRKLSDIALNYAYFILHPYIWDSLSRSYSAKEDIIQNRIIKLRNEMNMNLSLNIFDSKHEVNKLNILPSVEALKMMEKSIIPQEKLQYLDRTIILNNHNSNEDSISLMILTIVVGGLKNAILHAVYLSMFYKNNANIDILSSAITFLLT